MRDGNRSRAEYPDPNPKPNLRLAQLAAAEPSLWCDLYVTEEPLNERLTGPGCRERHG